MNKLRSIILLTSIIVLMGNLLACNTSRKVTKVDTTPTIHKAREAEDYLKHIIDFKSFSGRAELNIINAGNHQNVTANLRMRKDQDIWSSIIALGIAEVARAYVTPDSLQALVRIGRKAYSLPYEQGLQLINADFEFPALQNLLIGNPLIQDAEISHSEEKEDLFLITMKKDDFVQILSYDKNSGLLKHLSLVSEARNFSCTIEYEQYKALALNQFFAHSKSINIQNGSENIRIKMDFNRAEIDIPVDMSFSIPSSYDIEKL